MSYLGQGLGLGREERFTATATAGQTTVTVGDDGRSISYTPNYVDVYLNGIKMVNGSDVTVTSGTSIVFASALSAGDSVDVVAPGYFQPADTVSRSLGGTFLGAVNLPSGGLNVGSGQLKVDSSGRVTMGNQPAFHAYHTSVQTVASGSQAIPDLGGTRFNIGSHYNTATKLFTAPIAGIYFFSANIGWQGSFSAPRTITYVFKNGSQDDGINLQASRSSGLDCGSTVSGLLYLAAGDTAQMRCYQDSGATQTILGNNNQGWTWFAGRLAS